MRLPHITFETVRQPRYWLGGRHGCDAARATAAGDYGINRPRRKVRLVNTANEPATSGSPRDGAGARTLRGISPAAARGLSIMVPLYNEAASVGRLHAQLIDVAQTLAAKYALTCEVIYVDDGSSDDSLAVAAGCRQRRSTSRWCRCRVISARRRRCLPASNTRALAPCCSSTATASIPPSLIETLVGHWLDDGYDVVYTAKAHRAEESATRRLLVKGFYLLINWGARTKSPKTPAISGCCRRAPPRHCAACPSAIASSRACRAGSAFAKSVSTTSRRRAPTAAPRGMCARWSAYRSMD